MKIAGLDIGSRTVKLVVMDDSKILLKKRHLTPMTH